MLHIRNLPEEVTDADLRSMAAPYGQVPFPCPRLVDKPFQALRRHLLPPNSQRGPEGWLPLYPLRRGVIGVGYRGQGQLQIRWERSRSACSRSGATAARVPPLVCCSQERDSSFLSLATPPRQPCAVSLATEGTLPQQCGGVLTASS